MRIHALLAGQTEEMAKRWEAYLPPHLALSPLMGAFLFCLNCARAVFAYRRWDKLDEPIFQRIACLKPFFLM